MLKLIAALLFLTPFFSSTSYAANPQDYMVLGVIASNNDHEGVALLKHRESGKVTAHREGTTLDKDLVISRIYRKEVFFKHKNEYFRLAVGSDTPIRTSDGSMVASRGDVDAKDLRNKEGIEFKDNTLTVNSNLKTMLVEKKLSEILMQSASEPHMENGRLVGFKLWDIEKGSIFDVAGFRDGDLITHINDQPINSAAVAIRVLNQLRNAAEAEIGFTRGGAIQHLKIVVQ